MHFKLFWFFYGFWPTTVLSLMFFTSFIRTKSKMIEMKRQEFIITNSGHFAMINGYLKFWPSFLIHSVYVQYIRVIYTYRYLSFKSSRKCDYLVYVNKKKTCSQNTSGADKMFTWEAFWIFNNHKIKNFVAFRVPNVYFSKHIKVNVMKNLSGQNEFNV